MDGTGHRASSIDVPNMEAARRAERNAQQLFRSALACWASDVLILRRIHRDRLAWTAEDAREAQWPIAA